MAKFIVSHRLATGAPTSKTAPPRSTFESILSTFQGMADIKEVRPPESDTQRGLMFLEGDAHDFEAKRKEAPADIIIEPEKLRAPCLFMPTAVTPESKAEGQLGLGSAINLAVRSNGLPVAGASVTLFAMNLRLHSPTSQTGVTDEKGAVSIPFDPRLWAPMMAIIMPKSGAWAWSLNQPQHAPTVDLPPLPKNGPLGWWHHVLGINKYSEKRGEGIRVGVVDSGIGPNPAVAHAQPAGAFVNGAYTPGADATRDVGDHGTHVAGIIGARPVDGSGDFAGIAPGADLIAARVYAGGAPPPQPEGTTNNGDIAAAIDQLSGPFEADIINLSLSGSAPSDVEWDAITSAVKAGSIVICAAGNQNGGPIMFPAAYPQAVAVAALGLVGTVPGSSLDAISFPSTPDRFTPFGLYVPTFNNIGPEMKCSAPGVGIISTVPGDGTAANYAALSGTSMASPAVCGALATLLSNDSTYRGMPRGMERAQRAWMVLFSALRSLGLQQFYQGYGLSAAWPG